MSEWKQERVRARLARQGAEDRPSPPARRKAPERDWLVVEFGGHWWRDNPHTVWSRHPTEDDARKQLLKRGWNPRANYVVNRDLWERVYKPLWR